MAVAQRAAAVDEKANDDGVCTLEVHTDRGQDLREPLAKKLVEKGWGVRRLELRRARLEEVYMNVVFQRG